MIKGRFQIELKTNETLKFFRLRINLMTDAKITLPSPHIS